MLNDQIRQILSASRQWGWVQEPEAKRLFSLRGMNVPRFLFASRFEEVLQFTEANGFPVVCKVVSPRVLHKSDAGGVVVGVESPRRLKEVFDRFSRIEGFRGVLVEEMLSGMELIVGAKVDYQFGPVILLGMGGTGVEIYEDVTLRMAPLEERDVMSMVQCLRGFKLLEGYRGSKPIDFDALKKLLLSFSALVMELEDEIESIDLNPVLCSQNRCVIADARIILSASAPSEAP